MGARRIIGIIVGVLGALLFVGSFVWRGVAIPALVRFPTDLNVSPQYTGTVTLFIDPSTYQVLDQARQFPLTVHRTVKADGNESSHDLVVLDETLDLDATGLFQLTQRNRYVMNRRTILNVDDPRAYVFTPLNKVNRAGDFRLSFPFDTKQTDYPIYKNEIGAAYTAKPANPPTGTVAGMSTLSFAGDEPAKPVTAAYLAWLGQAFKLPGQLTLDQLKPILKNAGFDIDAMLPKLLPQLTPTDVQAIVALAGKPIDIAYQMAFTGTDDVEPYTGAIADVPAVDEMVTGVPTGDSVSSLKTILGHYPASAEAQAGLAALAKLNASPIKIFENKYAQTDASVVAVAKTIKDQKDKRHLVESTVPNSMLIGGIVLAVVGALLIFLPRRRRTPAAAAPDAGPAPPSPPPPDAPPPPPPVTA